MTSQDAPPRAASRRSRAAVAAGPGKTRATPARRRALPGRDSGRDAADRTLTRTERAAHRRLHPWYSRKRYLLPLLAVVLVTLAALSWTLGRPPETPPPAPLVAQGGIGTPVQDGWFRFTVRDVEDLGKVVGEGTTAAATANGTYVVVHVDVTNTDTLARELGAANQRLVDTQGAADATIIATMESGLPGTDAAFLEAIAPGSTSRRVPLLFDVPAGFERTAIELVGSPFTPGVRVAL